MLTLKGVQITAGSFSLRADFAIPRGGRVAVMGPSGAGKSTLLSAISGFAPLSAGQILWDGRTLEGLAPADRPLSVLFQDNNLFPHLTAAQNVALGLRPSLRLSAGERARVDETLAQVGLGAHGDHKPAALSGGQQSRVALARVLLRNRPVLLLDEPFAALGPGMRGEMLDLVLELAGKAGQTLVMVTHDMRDARQLGGDMVFVDSGRAAAPVATEQLFANPPAALKAYIAK